MSAVITIPTQWHVGFISQRDTVNLGFAIPTDATNFRKRLVTVTNWADKSIPAQVFDNTPQTGFKLSRNIKRGGWYGGNVVWRVEDPRGFELEISSDNLAAVATHSTISNGEIMEPCVWGATNQGKVVLLPTSSEPYSAAVATTVRRDVKVSLKDIEVGDLVELKDGTRGYWMGALWALVRGTRLEIKKQYVVHMPVKDITNGKCIIQKPKYGPVPTTDCISIFNNPPHVSAVIEHTERTAHEMVTALNTNNVPRPWSCVFGTGDLGLHYWAEKPSGVPSYVLSTIPTPKMTWSSGMLQIDLPTELPMILRTVKGVFHVVPVYGYSSRSVPRGIAVDIKHSASTCLSTIDVRTISIVPDNELQTQRLNHAYYDHATHLGISSLNVYSQVAQDPNTAPSELVNPLMAAQWMSLDIQLDNNIIIKGLPLW